jgi:hypothetical protein
MFICIRRSREGRRRALQEIWRNTVKKTIAAMACLMLLGSSMARAQDPSSRNLPPKSQRHPTARPDNTPVAPVGHRQPRPGDVPSETRGSDPGRIDAQDRDLDRMIKGICKGC